MTSENRGNLLDQSALEWWQNTFVRFKGFYEGLYKGFYRNSAMEYAQPIDQCLTDESYDSLGVIYTAVDKTMQGDPSQDMMGFNAFVRLVLDNEKNCNFDRIMMDSFSFCFINNCSMEKLIGNFYVNWAEEVYAMNMIWTNVFSASIIDFSLESDYRFYHVIGENSAILLASLIGYQAAELYDYDPND